MTRADWQQNAEERLQAADALLLVGLWSSAYYLAGYAVEAGLKSCILVRVRAEPEVVFQKKNFSADCWVHDIQRLVVLAGLERELAAATAANATLASMWAVVVNWNEASRYTPRTEAEARQLFDAITDTVDGVMTWVRRHW
jgi:HEPN domain-containing protein